MEINTRYFHLTALIHRRRNRIERLQNNDDIWIESTTELKRLSVWLLQFSLLLVCYLLQRFVPPNFFIRLDPCLLNCLARPDDVHEVKNSLFSIGGLMALGINNFLACFYQEQWNTCSNDILSTAFKYFLQWSILTEPSKTLPALVSKGACPLNMKQFWLISLCCTLYKVISKMLVAQIRPLFLL